MRKEKQLFVVFSLIIVFLAVNVIAVAQEIEKININTATVEELARLEKVGPKIAAKIIEYREGNGPFEKPEDIMKVKGIGEKIFEMNKDRIVVE